MIRKSLVFGLLLVLVSFGQTPARLITLEKADGGSVVTNLSMGIAVNKNSTLTRRWFTLNDSSCPVYLGGRAGVKSIFRSERSSGSYSFAPTGIAHAQKAIRAVSIVFVIFDVWGDRMRNLGLTQVTDISEDGVLQFDGSWYASENDVREFYTSVAFADRVMLSDGSIWKADRKAIAEKLSEVQIRVSEAGLESEPPKEPKK